MTFPALFPGIIPLPCGDSFCGGRLYSCLSRGLSSVPCGAVSTHSAVDPGRDTRCHVGRNPGTPSSAGRRRCSWASGQHGAVASGSASRRGERTVRRTVLNTQTVCGAEGIVNVYSGVRVPGTADSRCLVSNEAVTRLAQKARTSTVQSCIVPAAIVLLSRPSGEVSRSPLTVWNSSMVWFHSSAPALGPWPRATRRPSGIVRRNHSIPSVPFRGHSVHSAPPAAVPRRSAPCNVVTASSDDLMGFLAGVAVWPAADASRIGLCPPAWLSLVVLSMPLSVRWPEIPQRWSPCVAEYTGCVGRDAGYFGRSCGGELLTTTKPRRLLWAVFVNTSSRVKLKTCGDGGVHSAIRKRATR